MKRFMAVMPTLTGIESLVDLRQRFDPVASIVPPHITLVFPFESDLTAKAVRDHVEESVRGVGSFPIRLSGVTGSEGEYLFLNVKQGNDTLIGLHDRLYTGTLRRFLSVEHSYLPHLTVGRLSSAEEFRESLTIAVAADLSFETEASAISVYLIESSGPLKLESAVMLH